MRNRRRADFEAAEAINPTSADIDTLCSVKSLSERCFSVYEGTPYRAWVRRLGNAVDRARHRRKKSENTL